MSDYPEERTVHYRCIRCHVKASAAFPPHTIGEDPDLRVCLGCWQSLQGRDDKGRIIPLDQSDAPWQFMQAGAQAECCCECHCCGMKGVEVPTTDDGWQSVYEDGDAESGPSLHVTVLCKGCVDDNHGRFY